MNSCKLKLSLHFLFVSEPQHKKVQTNAYLFSFWTRCFCSCQLLEMLEFTLCPSFVKGSRVLLISEENWLNCIKCNSCSWADLKSFSCLFDFSCWLCCRGFYWWTEAYTYDGKALFLSFFFFFFFFLFLSSFSQNCFFSFFVLFIVSVTIWGEQIIKHSLMVSQVSVRVDAGCTSAQSGSSRGSVAAPYCSPSSLMS